MASVEGEYKTFRIDTLKASQMEDRLASLAQVQMSDLLLLPQKTLEHIQQKLVKHGHWGCSDKNPGTRQCLASRIKSDCLALEDACVGRAALLWFFECTKTYFDGWIEIREKEQPLPLPEGSLIVHNCSKFDGLTRSLSRSFMSSIAVQNGLDAIQCETISRTLSSKSFLIHTITDTDHIRVHAYTTMANHCTNNGICIGASLKRALEANNIRNAESRNQFVKTVGHANHVIALLKQPHLLAQKMPERKNWVMARDSMIMMGPKLLVYRVEWQGAEKCPIYSYFEKTYIGALRGNVDWFICNVANGSMVWVPDLVAYQAGLFGFLQGPNSPYRLDLGGVSRTILSSFLPDLSQVLENDNDTSLSDDDDDDDDRLESDAYSSTESSLSESTVERQASLHDVD